MLVCSVISVLAVNFSFFLVLLWRFYVQVKEFAPHFVDIKKANCFGIEFTFGADSKRRL